MLLRPRRSNHGAHRDRENIEGGFSLCNESRPLPQILGISADFQIAAAGRLRAIPSQVEQLDFGCWKRLLKQIGKKSPMQGMPPEPSQKHPALGGCVHFCPSL